MGASGWQYFVPFTPDVNQALQALRKTVFEGNDYVQDVGTLPPFDQFCPPDPAIWDAPEELAMWKNMYAEEVRRHRKGRAPRSPDDALSLAGTEGTHSIIDIRTISETDDRSQSGHLSEQDRHALFGTLEPTKEMVLAKQRELQDYRGRWLCTYVVVFAAGAPSEFFFTGFSGD